MSAQAAGEGPAEQVSSTPPVSMNAAVASEPARRPTRSATAPSDSMPSMMPATCARALAHPSY